MTALAIFGFLQAHLASDRGEIALARQLASRAQFLNATGPSNQLSAALITIQSMKLYPTWEAARLLINSNSAAYPVSRMMHDDFVTFVTFSPDGRYIVSVSRRAVRVWEAATGSEVAHVSYVCCSISVAFSLDGKYIIADSMGYTVRVLDIATGTEVARMNHDGFVSSFAFSPDGKYVVSGGDDAVRVWDAATGTEIARMTHAGDVSSVAFSPDRKFVVSGSDDFTARVWEVATGTEIARMSHDDVVSSVTFSPDARYIVTVNHGAFRVWEAATGTEVTRMNHAGVVSSVAFSPDGKYIVSGSRDLTARVWEAATATEVARMTHDGDVSSVAFSPDGRYIVSGSEDNTARVWIWQAEDLIGNACSVMPRNLTLEEWSRDVGFEVPYEVICDADIYPNAIVPEDAQESLHPLKNRLSSALRRLLSLLYD